MNAYPDNWNEIRLASYRRAGWRCEHCGEEFIPGTTKAKTARNSNGAPLILTIHHLDGNKSNNDFSNLLVCDQRCHLHIQGTWKPGRMLPAAWWPDVPHWIIERGLAYVEPPRQLGLFG